MSIGRNIKNTILTSLPVLALGFVSGIFITRILGPEGRGVYSIFQANIDLFALIFSFSVGEAVTFFVSNQKMKYETVFSLAVVTVIAGILLLILFLVLLNLLGFQNFIFPKNYANFVYYLYVIALVAFTLFSSIIISFLSGEKEFGYLNSAKLILAIFNLTIFTAIFFNLDKINLEKVNIIFIALFSIGFAYFIGLLIVFYRKYKEKIGFSFNLRQESKLMYSFVGISYLSVIINFLNYRLDVWIVEGFRGSYELGLYSLAVGTAQLMWVFANAIVAVLYPSLNSLTNETEQLNLFTLYSRIIFTITLIFCVPAFFLSDYIIPFIYGNKFADSVLPFKILLFGILFSNLTKIFAVIVIVRNKVQYNLLATIIGVVFTLVLDFLLIPIFGIIGASVTTSITYFAVFLTVQLVIWYKLKLPFKNYYIIEIKDLRELKKLLNER